MTKPSDNSFNQTSCRAVEEKSNAHERVLMEWSTKTIKSPPKKIMKAQLWLFAGATLMNIFVTFITRNNLPQYMLGLFSAYVFSYALAIYFILILRQKTVFNYSITENHGKVEYFRHYPESSGTIFKSLAIFILLFFTGVGDLYRILSLYDRPGSYDARSSKTPSRLEKQHYQLAQLPLGGIQLCNCRSV